MGHLATPITTNGGITMSKPELNPTVINEDDAWDFDELGVAECEAEAGLLRVAAALSGRAGMSFDDCTTSCTDSAIEEAGRRHRAWLRNGGFGGNPDYPADTAYCDDLDAESGWSPETSTACRDH